MTMCDVAQRLEDRGIAIGRKEGRAEGVDRMSKLVTHLLKQGNPVDAERAASDPEFREQMFKALNL